MKHSIKLTLMSAIILGGFPLTMLAADQDVDTKATVDFQEPGPETPVDPVDPENPEPKPIIPVEPGLPKPPVYPGGSLRLNHVPTISFGSNKVVAGGAIQYAQLENVTDVETNVTTAKASFVEVADETGKFKGWTVNVATDGIFKSTKNDINGIIGLTDGSVRGLFGMDEQKDKFPVANQTIAIGKDASSAQVMKAEAGQGYNKWQVRYGHSTTATLKGDDGTLRNPNVSLTIPKGQAVYTDETYTANLVWTLQQGL